jgi:hypothetical protein
MPGLFNTGRLAVLVICVPSQSCKRPPRSSSFLKIGDLARPFGLVWSIDISVRFHSGSLRQVGHEKDRRYEMPITCIDQCHSLPFRSLRDFAGSACIHAITVSLNAMEVISPIPIFTVCTCFSAGTGKWNKSVASRPQVSSLETSDLN